MTEQSPSTSDSERQQKGGRERKSWEAAPSCYIFGMRRTEVKQTRAAEQRIAWDCGHGTGREGQSRAGEGGVVEKNELR